jgi:nitroreductase
MIENRSLVFSSKIAELIQKRYSCRTYKSTPLSIADIHALQEAMGELTAGPRSNQIRMKIVAAEKNDGRLLKGLGTYGFIKNPAGFIIGSTTDINGALEDFGYLLEVITLKATDLGLGTCWLGGTFTKSRFMKIMEMEKDESIPSVISIGYPADHQAWVDRTARIYAGSDRRLPWHELFFIDSFQNPLSQAQAGAYQEPLELVRLAPSASNKQPWRILKDENRWHFYLQRSNKYPPPVFNFLLGLADLQRVDTGIAMSHFELSALELGLSGKWVTKNPGVSWKQSGLEYNITWVSEI